MATMSPYAPSAVVSVYTSATTGNYCAVASVALAAYAWLDSLGDEITLMWSSTRKRTCAMTIYALTRYATLIAYTFAIVPLGQLPLLFRAASNVAAAGELPSEAAVTSIVVLIAPAAFSALRIYALSRSNKPLAALTFFLLLAPCVVDTMFSSRWIDIEEWPSPFYCAKQSTASVELTFRSIADIAGLRDGNRVLATLNTLRIVFSAFAVDTVFSAASIIPVFTDLLGSIIISRFMLDLRKVNHDTSTPLSTLSFVGPRVGENSASESLSNSVAPFSHPACTAEES
ncbi:hypothetical protein C8T65DRAFT_740892 [Cerioporus squamosus]|nr:hypothetical protein C8T65DRAFT_740892 [Cerioporus squamosus]